MLVAWKHSPNKMAALPSDTISNASRGAFKVHFLAVYTTYVDIKIEVLHCVELHMLVRQSMAFDTGLVP